MAIKEFVVFRGSLLKLYEKELQERLETLSSNREGRLTIDLEDYPEGVSKDGYAISDLINDDGLIMEPDRQLFIKNADAWQAAPLDDLVRTIRRTETEWSVLMIHRSGRLPKSIQDSLTEDLHEHFMELDDDKLPRWIVEWLAGRNVKCSLDLAEQISYHSGSGGDNKYRILDVTTSLAELYEGKEITWDDVVDLDLPGGSMPFFDLSKAIAGGDKEQAIEVMERIVLHSSPLAVTSFLINQYRRYLMIIGGGRDAESQIVSNGYASSGQMYYAKRDAALLSKAQAIRSFGYVVEADSNLKGGSNMDQSMIMELLAIQLTQQFKGARSQGRRKR